MPEPAPTIEVLVEDVAWRRVPRVKNLVARAVAAAFDVAVPANRPVSACVALVRDRAIAELNHDFRGVKGPTDVLAFPQIDGGVRRIASALARAAGRDPVPLGDVIVAYGACARGAREARVPIRSHVAHLVVHGALHLLGHDHAASHDTVRMRALEREALTRLGIPDPYAERAMTSRSTRASRTRKDG
ncbi:MAG: rRNA maturation RNase YbeY [Gemmatimonas sp.]